MRTRFKLKLFTWVRIRRHHNFRTVSQALVSKHLDRTSHAPHVSVHQGVRIEEVALLVLNLYVQRIHEGEAACRGTLDNELAQFLMNEFDLAHRSNHDGPCLLVDRSLADRALADAFENRFEGIIDPTAFKDVSV